MSKKTNDNALGEITGSKCELEQKQYGKYEVINHNGGKCEIVEEQFGKYEVESSGGGKYEGKAMHRNKNYCPECGWKYSSEKDAFCPQCGHPRVVKKTW